MRLRPERRGDGISPGALPLATFAEEEGIGEGASLSIILELIDPNLWRDANDLMLHTVSDFLDVALYGFSGGRLQLDCGWTFLL